MVRLCRVVVAAALASAACSPKEPRASAVELDGEWSAAERLDVRPIGAQRLTRLASAPSGHAVAAWALARPEPGVWIDRFDPVKGWGKAARVSGETPGLDWATAQGMAVAIDRVGASAAAVWTADARTWASMGSSEGLWSEPKPVSGETYALGNTQAVMLHDGRSVVFWACWPTPAMRGDVRLCANTYAPGSGWGLPRLSNRSGESFPYGSIQASPLPDGEVGVLIGNGSDGAILLHRFSPRDGWRPPERISPAGDAQSPRLAWSPDGQMLAVWIQNPRTWNTVHARRFLPGRGWGEARAIGPETVGTAAYPEVAMNSHGDAVALWGQTGRKDSQAGSRIYASRTDGADAAAGPEMVSSDIGSGGKVVIDERNGALAVWAGSNGGSPLYFSRFVAGRGWTAPMFVGADERSATGDLSLVPIGADGALLVWLEFDGVRKNLWARRWRPRAAGAPASPAVPPAVVVPQEAPSADLVWATFLAPGLFNVQYPFLWNQHEDYLFGDYRVIVKFEEPRGRAQFQVMMRTQPLPLGEAGSLERMAGEYAARVKENGTALETPNIETLTIQGRPARRVAFPARGPGRTIAMSFTFVLVDGRLFAVVTGALPEEAEASRPLFAKMTASLRFDPRKPD